MENCMRYSLDQIEGKAAKIVHLVRIREEALLELTGLLSGESEIRGHRPDRLIIDEFVDQPIPGPNDHLVFDVKTKKEKRSGGGGSSKRRSPSSAKSAPGSPREGTGADATTKDAHGRPGRWSNGPSSRRRRSRSKGSPPTTDRAAATRGSSSAAGRKARTITSASSAATPATSTSRHRKQTSRSTATDAEPTSKRTRPTRSSVRSVKDQKYGQQKPNRR